jgi:hypothetical protein
MIAIDHEERVVSPIDGYEHSQQDRHQRTKKDCRPEILIFFTLQFHK